MVQSSNQRLTLEKFLALPEGDITYEFVNGEAVPKYKDNEISPKFFHGSTTGALFILLSVWAQAKGRVVIEWAIKLTRNQQDWMPVADLTYTALPAIMQYSFSPCPSHFIAFSFKDVPHSCRKCCISHNRDKNPTPNLGC